MLKQVSFVFFLLYSCSMGVESQEWKHLTHLLEVMVPAEEAWELYRNLGVVKLAAGEPKNVIQSLEVRGIGGVGTSVNYNLVPDNSTYLERFTKIDDEKRTKVAEGLGGGCLESFCEHRNVQFDIIEETNASCIIKSDIKYVVKKEFEADDPKPDTKLVEDFAQIAKVYLEEKLRTEPLN